MPNASTPLEQKFTIETYRRHLPEMPRDLLEMQFLLLLKEYMRLRDGLDAPAEEPRPEDEAQLR